MCVLETLNEIKEENFAWGIVCYFTRKVCVVFPTASPQNTKSSSRSGLLIGNVLDFISTTLISLRVCEVIIWQDLFVISWCRLTVRRASLWYISDAIYQVLPFTTKNPRCKIRISKCVIKLASPV